jgi:hypothetical protein
MSDNPTAPPKYADALVPLLKMCGLLGCLSVAQAGTQPFLVQFDGYELNPITTGLLVVIVILAILGLARFVRAYFYNVAKTGNQRLTQSAHEKTIDAARSDETNAEADAILKRYLATRSADAEVAAPGSMDRRRTGSAPQPQQADRRQGDRRASNRTANVSQTAPAGFGRRR